MSEGAVGREREGERRRARQGTEGREGRRANKETMWEMNGYDEEGEK